MYVTGTIRSTSVTCASSSQASSTWSMFAMSAMEQPAFRSGRITRWWSPVRTSADSAMKWTPRKTMSVAAAVVRGEAGQLEGVAPEVGPLDDLVALVVVAQDQEPGAELVLRGPDPRPELFGPGQGVAVRQGGLQSQHWVAPSGERAPILAGGDSLVATPRGCRPRNRICGRKYQARPPFSIPP